MSAPRTFFRVALSLAVFLVLTGSAFAAAPASDGTTAAFPRPIASYNDAGFANMGAQMWHRAVAEPFNVIATAIFLLAIVHTFLASRFLALSHACEKQYDALEDEEIAAGPDSRVARRRDRLQFRRMLYHFLGEVEAIFGIWAVPLMIAIISFHGWKTMVSYLNGVNYTEPIFVAVIMVVAASKPILRFAEGSLAAVVGLWGGGVLVWWLVILTLGPMLGSFITEPAAMTICALLLRDRFFKLQPSQRLKYATLGLLFVNVSVGGTLTHFAAPPVVMVASTWDWSTPYMFTHFGWKAVVGILISTGVYFLIFRKELRAMVAPARERDATERPVPAVITGIHLLFIGWLVFNAHYPPLVVFGLLFFLAFVAATERHQMGVTLRSPLLVGFFLASLVIHGGCQQWWISPVIGGLGEWPLMLGATVLTAFNDNAAITYLASLVPGLSDSLKFAVVAGAVAGGGLTVIANAPNPAGQALLQKYFGPEGISPLNLFLGALVPTLIVGAAFMLLGT